MCVSKDVQYKTVLKSMYSDYRSFEVKDELQ